MTTKEDTTKVTIVFLVCDGKDAVEGTIILVQFLLLELSLVLFPEVSNSHLQNGCFTFVT